ncbi:MAG: hypothetical protein ABIR70_18760 [Bryobacteraceae bacterium]
MNPDVQVTKALRALADHDRGLEARASAADIFARRQPVTHWRRRAGITAGLAAAAALLVSVLPRGEQVQPEAPRQTVIASIPVPPEPTPVADPLPKRVRRAKRPEPEREVVTEFYSLMDAPPPFERGQLLRVVVPASTMRTVGLPVSPERWGDRVQADVLVGEEGMARAIRFVSYQR